MKVSVLCAARNSIYHELDGVDVYDETRDAYTFAGGTPIIGHPPCRHWSLFCRQQADKTTEEREKKLGLWCIDQLMKNGGVIEQPWGSLLFKHLPGEVSRLSVPQYWFGYPTMKSTWLAYYRCTLPEVPYRLHDQGNDRRRMAVMSKNQRSATTRQMAEWLIAAARTVDCGEPHSERGT